jgi:predicted amidohydrolase YtcJ
MKQFLYIFLFTIIFSLTNAQQVNNVSAVYYNGDIITMKGNTPHYVKAIAVSSGKIIYVGSKEKAIIQAGEGATLIDLAGKTLLPGFIDAHGHLINYGKNLTWAQLRSAASVDEVINRMKEQAKNTPEGQWIIGFGYMVKNLAEKRVPTAAELDQVSKDHPVLIMDASGHAGSINSVLMRQVGYTSATQNPEGGEISRKPGTNEPLGPINETALNKVLLLQPAASPELADKIITGAADLWAQYGQTTGMECGFGRNPDDIFIAQNAIDKNLLKIDLLLYAKESETDHALNAAMPIVAKYQTPDAIRTGLLSSRPDLNKGYINRVKLAGVKYWLDGDLFTMWMTQPYTNNPPGVTGAYNGFGQIPDSVLNAGFDRFWKTNFQIHMHMNGDAAAEQALVAIENAVKKYGKSDHRPVFVHASYMRPDQIKRMKAVGGIPSYLVASIPAGGSTVLNNFGKERADHMVATNTMIKNGMKFTISHDAPVSGTPAILPLVWAAVNRTTNEGLVIGADEKITPYQGLLAVTNYAAYQIKEENSKGSLEVGKLADMVILDKNPLKVLPETIKDIEVLETIKEGVSIFKKK